MYIKSGISNSAYNYNSFLHVCFTPCSFRSQLRRKAFPVYLVLVLILLLTVNCTSEIPYLCLIT
ncbi:hypothetical protein Avbf_15107 [Armadillidium vulgare]|nr:hypothetical protein Avbf_15107 [Armadillidium vulgare]